MIFPGMFDVDYNMIKILSKKIKKNEPYQLEYKTHLRHILNNIHFAFDKMILAKHIKIKFQWNKIIMKSFSLIFR